MKITSPLFWKSSRERSCCEVSSNPTPYHFVILSPAAKFVSLSAEI